VKTKLQAADVASVIQDLAAANQKFLDYYPGINVARLPIHTLYGGAHLFTKETPLKLSRLAKKHFDQYAANFSELARALNLQGCEDLPTHVDEVESLAKEVGQSSLPDRQIIDHWIAVEVYARVSCKLGHEAIEDQRIDFEDGYGARADDEEDAHAYAAAVALATAHTESLLPPFIGIRIKALTEETKHRSIRTLDLFLTTYAEQGVPLPPHFFVTLPKVTNPVQVQAAVTCIELLEEKCGFATGAIKLELMIETVQSIINPTGECGIPALVKAGAGRISSAILGTFDYTASCNIASHYQDHRHPSADFARQMMQASLTGTQVNLCDGITNIMPIAPYKGDGLTRDQLAENRRVVHQAWREHFNNIQHSLQLGFYQSWDLNPAQLPIRYASVYYFFLRGLDDASARLRKFIDQAAQASMVGNTFDDAASAQGLLNFFVNGISCGALKESEVFATGITLDELHGRSFQKIVVNRLKANS
jgi:citrate lyase beta subunit